MKGNMVVEALRYMLAEVEEKLTSVEEENARLKGVLREIRDLARTGLKPDIYPTEEIWLQHKINQIASMAHACIGKETTIN